MTKMKSKKMAKSTFAIIIMGIVMVAMLAFGGTFAYFTAQTTKISSGELTTGTIKLKNSAVTFATGMIMPGQELLSESSKISVDVSGSTAAQYVFVKLTIVKPEGAEATVTPTLNTTEWTDYNDVDSAVVAGTVYYKAVDANVSDPIDFCTSIIFTADANYVDATSGDNIEIEGAKISVTFESKSIQQFGFETNVKGAYEAVGFKAD